MNDTVQRLRDTADAFELAHAPHHVVLHMRAAADEIERLRAGGCARDQGTTQYCAEAAILADKVGKLEAECFSLSAWACVHLDGKTGLVQDEHGNSYCAKDKEIKRLTTALNRLADEQFSDVQSVRAFVCAVLGRRGYD